MTTALRVLNVARDELGTVEAPDGSTPYHRAYGLPFSSPWCAVFIWYVFRQAGASGLIHPKTAYTPTLAQWFMDRGRFDGSPRVGDLVFYNWPDSIRRIQHVGIVESVEPGAIVAIEGNTALANQSDGGRVMRRRRLRGPAISGYGHPAYTPPPSPAPLLPDPEDDVMTPIPILLDPGRTFHEAIGAEAGPASLVAGRAFVTFGSTYGSTQWGRVAALSVDGDVLGVWERAHTANNTSVRCELPPGTACVTIEGKAEHDGTRPWASYWVAR